MITTAYLTGKASYRASRVIYDADPPGGWRDTRREELIDKARFVWKLYIPAAISGTATLICIVGANRSSTKKTVAATTALGVAERAYSQYREKVVEEFGARKDQTIRDKVVADELERNPAPAAIVSGPGKVLCCELFTGRYFISDMETLRKAQNDINERILAHDYATLSDFYDLIGLEYTKISSNTGWGESKQMQLQFSTHLSNGVPCLAFDYSYAKAF